ncbi:MAG: tail fiber protein [Candidatus Pacebacteria bacterium]|nr:tail fiber protein [Candidatus Paceibacterota bacterium]
MQKHITKFLILTIILTAALSVNYLFAAWVGPTQAPPGGNTSTPIHIGSTNQVKDGGLSVNVLSVFGNEWVQGNLDVAGNIEASGTICGSDGCTSGGGVPTGTILPYGGSTAPSGWLLADGRAVSQVTYADLYAVIGTKFGNPEGGNFYLPDLRGRFPLGQDDMGGISANRVTATQADNLGQGSGEEDHTLTVAEMPAHTHPTGKTSYGDSVPYETYHITTPPYTTSTQPTGGNQAHNNMPPYLTINYIIKT